MLNDGVLLSPVTGYFMAVVNTSFPEFSIIKQIYAVDVTQL